MRHALMKNFVWKYGGYNRFDGFLNEKNNFIFLEFSITTYACMSVYHIILLIFLNFANIVRFCVFDRLRLALLILWTNPVNLANSEQLLRPSVLT